MPLSLDGTGSITGIGTFNFSDEIIHVGDTNTKIRFPAADTISFETNGAERLRIRSDGKVGIGTDDPTGKLEINTASSTEMITLNVSNANFAKIGHNSSGGVAVLDIRSEGHTRFLTGGNNERLRIHSNGNVKIGSGAPALAVGSGLEIDTGSAATIRLEDSGSSSSFEIQNTGGVIKQRMYNSQPWVIEHGSGEKLRITTSDITTSSTIGHLLLGTDTARTFNTHSGRLQVTGTTYSHSTISVINNEANGNGAYLFLGKQRSGAVGGSTAVQANDIIGELRFPAGDGTDMENYAARIQVKADQNASSNNTSGYIDIYTTRQNGSSHLKLRIGQNSNHGAQFSFGTETSDLNNTSTPDRTSLKVGPATHIEGVFGHNGTPGMYYNCYSGGNDLFYRGTRAPSGGDWRPCAYGQKYGGHYFYGDTSNTAWSAQQQITSMATNMQITREGYVLKGNTPGFLQRNMDGAEYNSGMLKGGNNQYNTGNHYNTSTAIFTAPVAGRYAVGCGILVNSGTGRLEGNISLNNSTRIVTFNGTGTTYDGPNAHAIVNLAANDNLRVLRQSGTAYPYQHENSYFYAYLIG